MSPEQQEAQSNFECSNLNSEIILEEVQNAVNKSKLGKDFLEVPNEALKNPKTIRLLHTFFNVCFKSGLTPLDWSKSDIKPIPNPGKDQRVPQYNRTISIICCIAKVYSYVLDCCVKKHLTVNDLLFDAQNGFRTRRSCVDHIFSLIRPSQRDASTGVPVTLSVCLSVCCCNHSLRLGMSG